MSDLLAYEMPITKIIEDNSLKDIRGMKKQKYQIPMFRVKQEKFAMRNHIDSNRKVNINREKLIDKLKDNRTQHDHIYNEAREGFQTELRETMQNVGAWLVEAVEQGHGVWTLDIITDKVSALSEIDVPQNYLAAYDEAIELFEWDESPVIVLTWSEFRKFVLDKWDWQDHFLASNAKHSGTARALRSRN